jgi:hypothetical protein
MTETPYTGLTWAVPALRCRAACDSRSADVFASVFYLPKPRPLNYLVNELWRGPTAVIQGVLDPLNDAQVRALLRVAAYAQSPAVTHKTMHFDCALPSTSCDLPEYDS